MANTVGARAMKAYVTGVTAVSILLYSAAWLTCSFVSTAGNPVSERTVGIGVIVDMHDNRSSNINRSVETTMLVSNKTRHVRMNPIIRETDVADNFKLRQTFCKLIDKHPIALLGTSRSETFDIIQSYSRALQIPFFLPSLARESTFDKNNYIIKMCPSFVGAAIDFIRFSHWDRIFYLFDSDDALWRLQKLYKAFNTKPIELDGKKQQFLIDAIRIPDVTNCRDVLRKLDRNYNFNTKRILVDLYSVNDYDTFLSQIIDVGMNRDGYHYLLGTLEIESMNKELWKSFTFGGVNITGFQLVNKNRWSHQHTALNEWIDDNISLQVSLTVDAIAVLTTALVEFMKNKQLWFRRGSLYLNMNCIPNSTMSGKHPDGPLLLKYIKNVIGLKGMSGNLAFDEYGYRKNYTLDLFHLSYRSPLKQVGSWHHGRHGSRLQTTLRSPKLPREEKNDTSIRIVTIARSEPFVMEKKKSTNGKPLVGNARYEGFCIDMIEEISKKVNFSYELKLVGDAQFGMLQEDNKTWDGMIGEVLVGTADIALSSLTITRSRELVVRFTKPFMNTGISIMIKKPEKDKPGVFSFMEPLSYKVWGCITLGFFAVSFILCMVGRFSPYEWQDNDGNDSAPSDTFSFVNTLWFSLGALMQQGPDIFPRSLSGRILGSAWWFFTLIMISSYTANLAAFLTFEKLTTPIDSADDLVKQTTIKYGIQGKGSSFEFFEISRVPVYQKMYQFMIDAQPSVFTENTKSGWERVISSKGKYAFLLESSSNLYYSQRRPCKTMMVGRNLDRKGYGIATRKEDKLNPDLNIAVLQMQEEGHLIKLEQKWWYSKGECGSSDGGDKGKSALNLSNVSGIFHILIGGLVLAMIISLSQIVCHTKLKPKTRKTTYTINNPPRENVYRGPKRVTIDDAPVITCTTSNGGESRLFHFDDNSEEGIISLDDT